MKKGMTDMASEETLRILAALKKVHPEAHLVEKEGQPDFIVVFKHADGFIPGTTPTHEEYAIAADALGALLDEKEPTA